MEVVISIKARTIGGNKRNSDWLVGFNLTSNVIIVPLELFLNQKLYKREYHFKCCSCESYEAGIE